MTEVTYILYYIKQIMDVREARNVIQQLLKSPPHLQQSTTYIEKQIQTKGFLLGLSMISTDDTGPDPTEQLISFEFHFPFPSCPAYFLIVSLSRPRPQVRRFRILEHTQTQIQREEHNQANSDGKNIWTGQ